MALKADSKFHATHHTPFKSKTIMTDPTNHAFYTAGQPAPPFKVTATKSGRQVSQSDCRGTVLGLIFHGRDNYQAAVDVNTAVRPVFPSATELTLASVLDLTIVPRLLQGAVKPMLEKAYDQAASQIPAGYDPADYVFLLPDWNGSLYKAFGVKNAEKMAALVVIDGAGTVVGSYQGPQPGEAALKLVQQAMG